MLICSYVLAFLWRAYLNVLLLFCLKVQADHLVYTLSLQEYFKHLNWYLGKMVGLSENLKTKGKTLIPDFISRWRLPEFFVKQLTNGLLGTEGKDLVLKFWQNAASLWRDFEMWRVGLFYRICPLWCGLQKIWNPCRQLSFKYWWWMSRKDIRNIFNSSVKLPIIHYASYIIHHIAWFNIRCVKLCRRCWRGINLGQDSHEPVLIVLFVCRCIVGSKE